MSESELQLIIQNVKNHLRIKKLLSIFCYFLILCSLSFYFANFFEKKKTVRVVNQLKDKKVSVKMKKVMINARLKIMHDDGKIYNISANRAFHSNDEDVTMEEVLAYGDIGKISAGQLKIDENGNHLVFSKNPVLILNQ